MLNCEKTHVDFPAIWKTEDGSILRMRRLEEADAEKLIRFVRGLSFAARYFRFGQGDYDPAFDEKLKHCTLQPEEGLHLVVLAAEAGGESIVGSARCVFQPDCTTCEFVIVIADAWGHHGVGHHLMHALIGRARAQGLQKMIGRILASNREMLQFVAGLGFAVSDSPEGDWMKIASIDLQS